MDTERAQRQLRLIVEIRDAAAEAGLAVWLRGGWAMDFFLGEFTRDHLDIDWFAWGDEADRLAAVLAAHGYAPVAGPPPEQQREFVKDGLDVGVALLGRDAAGRPEVGGGPHAGTPWPEAARAAEPGRLDGVECAIIGARDQIEIKRMMPVWVAGMRRRAKDAEDIARLEQALARRGGL